MHDEPHSDLEQRALAAWTPAEPPADFVDRVMRAADADPRLRAAALPSLDLPPAAALRWPRLAVAAIAAAAIAGTVAAAATWWPHRDPTTTSRNVHADDEQREAVALTPAAAKAPVAAVPKDLGPQVERYMNSYGAHHGPAFKFSGTVLVAQNGELLHISHYGRADLAEARPIDADTRFKIGSLTQQFTAAAVLQLRDAGKLQLDDELRAHLPDFTRPGVTIRHLLTHTSGIPNYTDSLTTAGVEQGTRYTPQQIAAIFKDAALEFRPGSEFDPSNSGYFLLGMLIEKLSAQPLGRYLEDHIFAPAGMARSGYGDHTRLDDREYEGGALLATGYEFSEDEVLVPVHGYSLSVYGGAAGMVSTPADLLRWDRALRVPNLILSQASLDEMFRAAESPTVHSGKYGLGWIVSQERGQTMVGHPGGVSGFNAAIARYLGDGITVLALANTEAIDCRNVLDAVSAIAHGEAVEPFPEPVEVPVPPAMFSRYLGDFVLTPAARTSLVKLVDAADLAMMEHVKIYDDHGRLFMLVPTHGAKWMHGLGEDRFFFKDQTATLAQFGPPAADPSDLQKPTEWLRLRQGELEFVLSRARPEDLPVKAIVRPGP